MHLCDVIVGTFLCRQKHLYVGRNRSVLKAIFVKTKRKIYVVDTVMPGCGNKSIFLPLINFSTLIELSFVVIPEYITCSRHKLAVECGVKLMNKAFTNSDLAQVYIINAIKLSPQNALSYLLSRKFVNALKRATTGNKMEYDGMLITYFCEIINIMKKAPET